MTLRAEFLILLLVEQWFEPLLSALKFLEFRVLVFRFEIDFPRLAAAFLIWHEVCV